MTLEFKWMSFSSMMVVNLPKRILVDGVSSRSIVSMTMGDSSPGRSLERMQNRIKVPGSIIRDYWQEEEEERDTTIKSNRIIYTLKYFFFFFLFFSVLGHVSFLYQWRNESPSHCSWRQSFRHLFSLCCFLFKCSHRALHLVHQRNPGYGDDGWFGKEQKIIT